DSISDARSSTSTETPCSAAACAAQNAALPAPTITTSAERGSFACVELITDGPEIREGRSLCTGFRMSTCRPAMPGKISHIVKRFGRRVELNVVIEVDSKIG